MSINDNKPTYGTVPADSGAKGSRRGVVVGLAAAACFAIGFAAASVGPTRGLRGTALYVKDESTVWNNEGKKDNINVGDVPAGGCVGGGCGTGGAAPAVKPTPAVKPAPPVKPVAGVAGVPGLGGATPPTPPAPPATPTTIGPVVQTGDKPITIGGPTQTDNCCQVFGSCPTGYSNSGNWDANQICCKDLNKGVSISNDIPTCPTTPANDPFPNPNWTTGDGIGPITTPKIGPIPTPHTETNGIFGASGSPFGAGGFDGGMGQGFPFTGGESTGVGAGPAVNMGAGMPGAGGEDVGFGVPHSHKTTPGGGVAAQGY